MSSDHGYFPPGSMLRRVQSERAVGLLYGQRALGIGAIDPRNFMGTLLHDRSADRPFHRLVATAKMFEAIFFGTREKADRILAAVHSMHSKVKGALPEDAGSFKAGTPYSAHDPELMLWTIAPAADSAVYFYELFVRELSERELDEFWSDYVRFGELFDMPASVAPTSWRELREYVDSKINGPDAFLTEEAQFIGRAVMLEIPTSASRRAPMQAHNLVMRGSLPPRIRRALRPPLDRRRRHRVSRRVAAVARSPPGHAARGPPRIMRHTVRRRRRRRAEADRERLDVARRGPARGLIRRAPGK